MRSDQSGRARVLYSASSVTVPLDPGRGRVRLEQLPGARAAEQPTLDERVDRGHPRADLAAPRGRAPRWSGPGGCRSRRSSRPRRGRARGPTAGGPGRGSATRGCRWPRPTRRRSQPPSTDTRGTIIDPAAEIYRWVTFRGQSTFGSASATQAENTGRPCHRPTAGGDRDDRVRMGEAQLGRPAPATAHAHAAPGHREGRDGRRLEAEATEPRIRRLAGVDIRAHAEQAAERVARLRQAEIGRRQVVVAAGRPGRQVHDEFLVAAGRRGRLGEPPQWSLAERQVEQGPAGRPRPKRSATSWATSSTVPAGTSGVAATDTTRSPAVALSATCTMTSPAARVWTRAASCPSPWSAVSTCGTRQTRSGPSHSAGATSKADRQVTFDASADATISMVSGSSASGNVSISPCVCSRAQSSNVDWLVASPVRTVSGSAASQAATGRDAPGRAPPRGGSRVHQRVRAGEQVHRGVGRDRGVHAEHSAEFGPHGSGTGAGRDRQHEPGAQRRGDVVARPDGRVHPPGVPANGGDQIRFAHLRWRPGWRPRSPRSPAPCPARSAWPGRPP